MHSDELKLLIQDAIPDAEISVQSEDNVHFNATVISDNFINKRSVARQQQVYAALGNLITNGTIHALSLKTYTKEEWLEQ